MKPATPEMIDLITSGASFAIAELFDVEFTNGNHDYFTDLDFDINDGVNIYKANSLRFEGLRYKTKVGLEVDEQEIRISAYPGETLGGANFFSALQAGLLDAAYITRKRLFWAATSQSLPQIYLSSPPIDQFILFIGQVAEISKIGRTFVEMKLKSPLRLLDINMPRNTYGPGCMWSLFDTGCTLLKSSYTFSGVVETVLQNGIEVLGGIPSPVGADSRPTYALGRLLFTSGANNNLQISIRTNTSDLLYYTHPPIPGVVPGDSFNAWPGCSKTTQTCSTKFNNIVNFRGFPRVPPVVYSV